MVTHLTTEPLLRDPTGSKQWSEAGFSLSRFTAGDGQLRASNARKMFSIEDDLGSGSITGSGDAALTRG